MPRSAQIYFGMIGMAVGIAVLLDAPMTAALLAFELSGSTDVGGASLLAAFVACMAVRRFASRSRRGNQPDAAPALRRVLPYRPRDKTRKATTHGHR